MRLEARSMSVSELAKSLRQRAGLFAGFRPHNDRIKQFSVVVVMQISKKESFTGGRGHARSKREIFN